jgi:CheY-like chemotaxis protein
MLWLYLMALLPVALLLGLFLSEEIMACVPKAAFTPLRRAVLLVDDDPKLCQITARNLQRRGFAVLVAADGETALRMAKTHPGRIDLLISDVIMPGMSGPLLAEQFQTMRPRTPVLLISGIVEGETLPRRAYPTVAYLGKPFTEEMLGQKIGQVLAVSLSAA